MKFIVKLFKDKYALLQIIKGKGYNLVIKEINKQIKIPYFTPKFILCSLKLPVFVHFFFFGDWFSALIFFAEQMVSAFVLKTPGISYSAHLGGSLCGESGGFISPNISVINRSYRSRT